MKKSKFLVVLLAVSMLSGMPALAKTAVSPVEKGKVSVTKEDFSNITDANIENTDWIEQPFGPFFINGLWCPGGMDFLGISSAKDVDASRDVNDKALHFKNAGNNDAQSIFDHMQEVTLQKGDIYSFSFDFARKSDDDIITVSLMAGNEDVAATTKVNNIYYESYDNTGWGTAGDANYLYKIFARDSVTDGTNALYPYEYYDKNPNKLPSKDGGFINYKIVIDTEDDACEGRQTISYYVNGEFTLKRFMSLRDASGKTSNKPISLIKGIKFQNNTLHNVDWYVDNWTFSVQSLPNGMVEDFSNVPEYTANDTIWQKNFGSVNVFSDSAGRTYFGITDGGAIPGIEKEIGDKVMRVDSSAYQMNNYLTKPNVILEKGDIYTYSFEYMANKSDTARLQFYLNHNPGPNLSDGETYSRYVYTPLSTKVSSNSEGAMLFNFFDGFYICGEVNKRLLPQTTGLNRYDVVLNTEDDEVDNKQTLAFYINGVLVDKGIFYERNQDGSAKTTPLTMIDKVSIRMENIRGENFLLFDNVWSIKTVNKLAVKKDGTNVNVSYSYPPLYETDKPSKFIAAWYSASGAMVEVKMADVITDATSRTVSANFAKNSTATTMKLFMFDNTSNIIPITPTAVVE